MLSTCHNREKSGIMLTGIETEAQYIWLVKGVQHLPSLSELAVFALFWVSNAHKHFQIYPVTNVHNLGLSPAAVRL